MSVCVSVCVSALNLRSLKSHDHDTWHVGPLSDVDVHGLSGILIFGRVAPQARLGLIFLFLLNLGDLKSHGHKTWHVGPLNDEELHGLSGTETAAQKSRGRISSSL